MAYKDFRGAASGHRALEVMLRNNQLLPLNLVLFSMNKTIATYRTMNGMHRISVVLFVVDVSVNWKWCLFWTLLLNACLIRVLCHNCDLTKDM